MLYNPKESYDHRICDDLSEVLLQFLPMKDKLRFECVSRRFQKTIFTKHSTLIIDSNMCEKFKTKYIDEEEDSETEIYFDSEKLEMLVRKFPNINRLYFRNIYEKPIFRKFTHVNQILKCNFNKIFEIIMNRPKECPDLIHCDLYYDRLERNIWEKFVSKYSTSLKTIYDLYSLYMGEIESLQSFENLEIWKLHSHHSYEVENNPNIKDKLELPNLKSLRFCYCCLDRTFLHQMAEHKNHFGYKLISSNQKITLTSPLKLICYMEFDSYFEIDHARNVFINY